MIPVAHRLALQSEPIQAALKQFGRNIRVSMPGIVQSFDPVTQTVSVQPAVTEAMVVDAAFTNVTLPVLDMVPIGIPRAGGWSLTFPIQPGDECELVFQDMAHDLWWQNGGLANQPDGCKFRHAIGDAVAWFGISSQPRRLSDYSTASTQLRSDDGSVIVDFAADGVTVKAPSVAVVSPSVTVQESGGTSSPLITQNFLDWFTTVYMPSVTYTTAEPEPLSPAPVTSVLQAG